MVKVRFVRVEKGQEKEMMTQLCRHVERWVDSGRRVVVLAADRARAGEFDETLWTFSDAAFVPHSVLSHDSVCLDRVVIATPDAGILRADVFVNLAHEAVPPADWEEVPTDVDVWEFVKSHDPEARKESHRKWQRYRELGLQPAEARLE
jgi:DNA polymerase IIIc chi subunit